jgi:hypothetical protein
MGVPKQAAGMFPAFRCALDVERWMLNVQLSTSNIQLPTAFFLECFQLSFYIHAPEME